MFGGMGQTNVKNLGNGGTMDGDVTITGDLTVSGGIGLSLSEVIEGTSTIDVTNTEAFLVRKNGDGGDVFIVDSTNTRIGVGVTPSYLFHAESQVDGNYVAYFKNTDADNGYGVAIDAGDDANVNALQVRTVGGSNLFVVNGAGNTLLGLSTADALLDAALKPALQIEGTTSSGSSLSIFRNDNGSSAPYLILGKSRGTSIGSDTVVQDNDQLGQIAFVGADGTDRVTPGARIFARVNGTPGSNDLPTELVFSTTADGASATTERVHIKSGGDVSFTGWIEGNDQNVLYSSTSTGALLQAPTTTQKIYFRDTNGVTGMTYDAANKRLGIGTDATQELEIKFATDKHMLFSDSQGETGNCPTIHAVNTAGSALVDLGFRGDNLLFATGSAERMRIASDGKVTFTQTVDGDAYIALDNVAGAGSSVNETSALHLNLGDGSTIRGGAKITAKKEADFSSGANMDASLMFSVLQNNAYNDALFLTSAGNVGIGATSPEAQLNIAKAGSSDNATFYIDTFSSGINNQSVIGLRKSNSNSVGTETTVEDNEKLGKIAWYGGETDGYDEAASIHAEVDGTPGSNDTDMPGALVFGTTADGTGSSAERMRITSTGNVNIGSVTSAIQATGLHVATGAAGAVGNITIESSSNATSPPTLHFAKARGSAGSRSAINTAGGDILGSLSFTGFDGAHDRAGAEINATSVATSSQGTDMPADLVFKTSADGSSSPTERMRIASTGNVGIGTSSPMNKAQINHSGADGDNALMLVNENTTVAADACLGIVGFDSADGNVPSSGFEASGYIAVIASENHSTTNKGGHILFGTTADGDDDDTTSNERMRITAMGNVEIGKQKGSTSTDTDVTIYGGEAGGAILGLYADNGDDNADKWQLVSRTNNNIALRSYSTGSWVYHLQLDANSRISLTNNDSGGTGGSDGLSANTIFGYLAGEDITTGGVDNTYFGHKAGSNNATGDDNVFIGSNAGKGVHGNSNSSNVGIGSDCMLKITTGTENVAIGRTAMEDANSGAGNTAIGTECLMNLTDGTNNVAIGKVALNGASVNPSNSTAVGYGASRNAQGSNNTSLGFRALKGVSGYDGTDNVAIGYEALDAVTDGESANVAIGYGSMGAVNESSSHHADANIAIGYNALTGGTLTDGNLSHNIAIGYEALDATGANDQLGTIAIGYAALGALTSGAYNTGVGYRSLNANQTGDGCTALGYDSLLLSTGNDNTAMGRNSLASNTSGASNTALGIWAGFGNATGGGNTHVGASAGKGVANNNNSNNTSVGYNALLAITTGSHNTAIGYQSGDSITEGNSNVLVGRGTGVTMTTQDEMVLIGNDAGAAINNDNADGTIAIGYNSLAALTSGARNTALGTNSLSALTGGSNNIAIGYQAMDAADGTEQDNIAIGYGAMGAFDEGGNAGDSNIAIGRDALLGGSVSDNTRYNVAIGNYALDATGTNHPEGEVAIGHEALSALTSGSKNTAIGFQAGVTLTTGYENTIVGHLADTDANSRAGCVIIGYNLSLNTASDNVVEIGNDTNSMTYDLDGGDITVTSDVRTKTNIKDSNLGLEFINKLRPVTYETKPSAEYPKEFGVKNPVKKKSGKTWDGLIAQEVKQVMDDMGVEFSGWSEGINTKQTLAYGKLVMPLIKAVQELSAKVEDLEKQLKDK